MNRLRIFITIALAAVSLGSIPVYAHGTEKDNDISVIYHIDPNDKAVAGKASTIYFFVTDKDNQYDDSKCDCRVKIDLEGKTIFDKVVHEKDYLGDPTSVAVKYVFPKLGVYTVSIDAKPMKADQFQPFKLSYTTTVKTGTPVSAISNRVIALGSGLAVMTIAGLSLLRRRNIKRAIRADSNAEIA